MERERWVLDPSSQVELRVPPFATPESTIRHHELASQGLLRRIRFFPDHGRLDPLWDDEADEYTVSAEELGLSSSLTVELRSWLQSWQERTERPHAEDDDDRATAAWEDRGDTLLERLREELWPTSQVDPEFRRARGLSLA
ncbi:hypothetical protein KXS11_11350 [Plantibacter flavus]|uniref:hypothetical protein n=1 Tax=Plantibacter flavus TaxID=150123 RepID=UPI003F16C155